MNLNGDKQFSTTMTQMISFALAILICGQVIFAHPLEIARLKRRKSTPNQKAYWKFREQIMTDEKEISLGGHLQLSSIEAKANEVLMKAKNQELNDGFVDSDDFLPSRNFMEVIPQIEKSEVFKILRDMPKGAVLHAHDTAIASFDYRFNLTYRENLYVCDESGGLTLKFFKTPDDNCNWQLLSDLRKDPAQADDINEKIKQAITMVTKNPNSVYSTVDKAWEKFSDVFKTMKHVLSYRPVYEELHYRNLQELYEDNVMYAEIRTTLSSMYDLDGKTYGPLEMVQFHKEASEKFVQEHPGFVGTKIIYAPQRNVDNERVDYYLQTMVQLKKVYPNFVAGFDLVGQEDKGKPLVEFASKLNALDPSIPYFFHAGETKWNGMSTDVNLVDAFLLNTKRIGHGYALMKHPLLWQLTKRLNIAVEVCPISNQVLGLVEDMRNHPAASLFASGSPVVVSNDDPGLWGARGLSYDFYEAFMGIMSASSDLRSLKQLALNSLTYSSMNKKEKHNATCQWQNKWNTFVNKLAKLA